MTGLLCPQRRSVTKVRGLKVRGPRVRQCPGHRAFAFPLRSPLSYKCLLVLSTSRPLVPTDVPSFEDQVGRPDTILSGQRGALYDTLRSPAQTELFLLLESNCGIQPRAVSGHREAFPSQGTKVSLVNYSLAKEPPGQP